MGSFAQLEGTPSDVSLTQTEFTNFGRIQKEVLGRQLIKDDKTYVFCKFNQDTDISAGDAVVLVADTDAPTVSGDTTGNSNGITGATFGAAVADHTPSTDTEDYYGWVQVEGPVSGLKDASNGIAAGDPIAADDGNDREFKLMAAGDEHEDIGYATTAASGGTFDAYLTGN